MDGIRGYLYILNDDHTFSIREGYVCPKVPAWIRHVRFIPDNGHWIYVSGDPGVMYYRKVWLPERDDELAKKLYIEYHEGKIKELERQLDAHKQVIATLRGEL